MEDLGLEGRKKGEGDRKKGEGDRKEGEEGEGRREEGTGSYYSMVLLVHTVYMRNHCMIT